MKTATERKTYSIRVASWLMSDVRYLSRLAGMTVSSVVESALLAYLPELEAKAKDRQQLHDTIRRKQSSASKRGT